MVHYRNETVNKSKALEVLADLVVDVQADILRSGAPPSALQMLLAAMRYRLSVRLIPLGYTEDQIDEELVRAYTRVAEKSNSDTSYIKQSIENMRKNSVAYGDFVNSPLAGALLTITAAMGGSGGGDSETTVEAVSS